MKVAGPLLRHLAIAACVIATSEALLWYLGTQSATVRGRTTSAYISEAGGGRGGGGPVVTVTFEYEVEGKKYESADVYQPRPPWGRKAWSAEERARAERFVAEHAPGANVTIRTSRVFPWSTTLVHSYGAVPSQDHGKPYWRWLAIAGGYAFFVFAKWLVTGVKFRTRR